MEGDIRILFNETYNSYKNYDERMGNKILFIYYKASEEVVIYDEDYDVCDCDDCSCNPYYWSLADRWENVSIYDFAEMMNYYLDTKNSRDYEKIYCKFEIKEGEYDE